MKNTLTILTLLSFAYAVSAQNAKIDKIIKRDYTIIDAIITKMSESNIEYTLPNETLVNVMEISKIARIDFANGRKQSFLETKTVPGVNEEVSNAPSQKKIQEYSIRELEQNTIAVLPIPFVNSETLSSSQEMAKFAQNDVYGQLIKRASNIFPLTVQDLRVTNSLLKKAGIDYKNIDEILIEDLQSILGVDNIIAAKVSYDIEHSEISTTYGSTELKEKKDRVREDDFSESSTYEEKNYNYTLYFDLYKNTSKIYTKTRQPFFNLKDSWIDSMTYLLKRCPIYSK
ncbi:hypothetical protein [Maribacter sp. 2304DJ31-5]|uniref:hypothetical protein n=1 Tax=Maribacter sp. 2304DJ31-5 TaxID=3386273 RepID=UPI0039BCABA5